MSAEVEVDQVLVIARDIFSSMIDGEAGYLESWTGDLPALDDPVVAWVGLSGPWSGRAVLRTESPTAHHLARALLGLPDDEEVSHADLVDAFGELANVVGGNVKALLPEGGRLSLPEVAAALPAVADALLLHTVSLAWRGRPLAVEIWALPAPDQP